jgi:hypothetical protein
VKTRGALAVLLVALSGCTTTGFRSTWMDPSVPSISLAGRPVAAFAIGIFDPLRRTAEDALVRELTARGVRAVAGSALLPKPDARYPETARSKLQHAGIEATVALRITARHQPAVFLPLRFWGHWDVDAPLSASEPDYIRADTVVWIEVRVHSIVDDKVLWVGESVRTNGITVRAFVEQLAAHAAEGVQNAGLLRP